MLSQSTQDHMSEDCCEIQTELILDLLVMNNWKRCPNAIAKLTIANGNRTGTINLRSA